MICCPPQPMWDITIHPLRGPASSLSLFPSSNQCGTAPKSTPLGPSVLTSTPPRVYPTFGEQREGWHIVRWLALIPFLSQRNGLSRGVSPVLVFIFIFAFFWNLFSKRSCILCLSFEKLYWNLMIFFISYLNLFVHLCRVVSHGP